MNVVIYSRVSSQSARQSTDRQVADLQKLAADRGYTVCAVFEEKISGCKAINERPVLLGCLDFCTDAQNHVDMLLVTEVSRLGRSTLEMLKALDMLHKHKVSVYIQNLNIETLLPDKTVNPLSSLITTLLGELAAMERQGILDRLNSGRALYIQKGGRLGRNPGSFKSREQKKEEYKEAISLLKKGYSIRNVAKLTGRAVSTIQTIKKRIYKRLIQILYYMKQGDTVFVSATATGLGKDKKAVIDKIENVMGTTFVTVTYIHPDAVSGLGGCFVASHIIETDSREKSLIRLALEDRWDAVTGNDDIAKVLTALYDWQVDELMAFIDGLVELKPNKFDITYYDGVWSVNYIFYHKKGENLKIVLFRLLQECLAEGKVLSEHLTGQNPKYLDFFSPDYGFN